METFKNELAALENEIPGGGIEMRLYHVVAINERTGKMTYCTEHPLSHKDACVVMSKFSHHPSRRIQLKEVSNKIRGN